MVYADFANLVVAAKKLLHGKAVVDCEIPALLSNGRLEYKRYLGSLDNVALLNVQRVKLVNISAYTHDEVGLTGWIEIPNDYYVVGVYRDGGYYILTKSGQPTGHPL
jgi:hypothetical protein